MLQTEKTYNALLTRHPRQRRARSRAFHCENLEQRMLLAGDITFDPPQLVAVGQSARYHHPAIAADFDLDGDQDLVVLNYRDDDFSVLLNNGTGVFAHNRNATGPGPWFGTAADLNGDEIPDLALVTRGDSMVSLHFGLGDGTFSAEVKYPTEGNSSAGVAVGDFDSDGDMDVAVGNQYTHDVSVLFGNGDGTHAEAVQFPSGGRGATGVTSGDFDGDGDFDLAVANYFRGSRENPIGVLLSNGDGTFAPTVSYQSGAESWDLQAADINGDGNLDLIASTISGPSVMIGSGDGTFTTGALYNTWPPGADWQNPDPDNPILQPYGLDLGDLDGDGNLDLVLANWSGQRPDGEFGMISIMLGNGDGTLGDPTTLDMGTYPREVAVADFDGDGDLDLAATDERSPYLYLRFNTTPSAVPDLDGDTDADCDDVDALVGAIAEGIEPPGFDLTGDDIVDNADLDMWLEFAGAANLPSRNPYPRGDADLNGRVDAADLNQVALHWRHNEAAWCSGDFTADGIVDAADLNALALNWQLDVSDTSETDPEAAAAAAGRRTPRAPLKDVLDRTLIGNIPSARSAPASTRHSRDGVEIVVSALKGTFAGQELRNADVDVPRRRWDSSLRFTVRAANMAAVEAGERHTDNDERIGRWPNNVDILNRIKR